MQHYGDVTKLSGYDLPVVDVITGGSPCQDLSVAKGNRDGLAGDRSGLFMEQIRIVREMRERDKADGRTGYLIRPRFMVWENVPGAFSSNKGADFQTVLTEIVRIIEPDSPIVPLPRAGRWPHSGCLYDELGAWSIAWRVHDAQFWGVPQRRKRIALVADFGGRCAAEVLFERKGLCRDIEESGEKRKDSADGTEGSAGKTGRCLNTWDVQSKHIQTPDGVAETLYSGECRGGEEKPTSSRRDDTAIAIQGNSIGRADTAGCEGRGWRRGGATHSTQSTDTPCGTISFQERAGKDGGVKESSYSENTQEHYPHSTTRECSEPIMIEMTSTKNTIIKGVSHTLTQRMGTGGNQVNAIWREDELRVSSVRGLQGNGTGERPEAEGLQGCDRSDYEGGVET